LYKVNDSAIKVMIWQKRV